MRLASPRAALARLVFRLLALVSRLHWWRRGARRTRRQVGEWRLVVYELGPPDGEPWLLLHGLGSTAFSLTALLPAFAGCRVVVPELSRLGGTSGPRAALAVRDGVEVLASLVHRLFPARPVGVCGLSLGGWTGVRLALERPEMVSQLLLVEPGGYAGHDWESVRALVSLQSTDDLAAFYGALFREPPWFFRLGRPAVLATYRSPVVTSVVEALGEDDLFDDADLARLAAPLALVWAQHDGLFPAAVGRAMAAAAGAEAFLEVPDCGHALHFEAPEALAEAVAEARAGLGVARRRAETAGTSRSGRAPELP